MGLPRGFFNSIRVVLQPWWSSGCSALSHDAGILPSRPDAVQGSVHWATTMRDRKYRKRSEQVGHMSCEVRIMPVSEQGYQAQTLEHGTNSPVARVSVP